ncbi:hypothetical protein [Vibrio phage vB_VmeM-Yong XC32]|nr:hypothetical protein [Vibrio phage vB_VmeM-Yong XC31]QAX96484.1 hypothetical protein [Vibrio phage vB_VmeM-Yong XC32]QAX96801.1 hypothetical protein [Vibrio phage vB_VmeM-Yong MS31]QAX97120.1 hypothetical protein [Vibrio phage vB_VmeM-Yong MS32]
MSSKLIFTMQYFRGEKKREYLADPETGLIPGTGETGGGLEEYDRAKAWDKDDVVIRDGAIFQANEDIPAGSSFIEGLTGPTWLKLGAEAVATLPDYAVGIRYLKDQAIARGRVIYRAKNDFTSAAWNPAQWETVFSEDAVRDKVADFSTAQSYVTHELVAYNGDIYAANEDMAAGAFDASKWQNLTTPNVTYVDDYAPGTVYTKDAVVMRNGQLFRATQQTATAWDEGDWQAVSSVSTVRGYWDLNATYKANEIVIANDRFYRANGDIGSGTTFTVGTGTEEWTEVSGPVTPPITADDFKASTLYAKNQVIVVNGILYRAKAEFTSLSAFSIADWDPVSYDPETAVDAWQANTDYKAGQLATLVVNGRNTLYRARADITGGASFVAAEWDDLTQTSTWRAEWDISNIYAKDDVVWRAGHLYIANDAVPINTAWVEGITGATWARLLAEPVSKISVWAATTSYQKDELLAYDGNIYRVEAPFVSGAAFTSGGLELLTAGKYTKIPAFRGSNAYVQDETIAEGGILYRAKADFTSATNFNEADWEVIADIATNILYDFSITEDYVENEIVFHLDSIWRAKGDLAPGAWDESDWEFVSEYSTFKGQHVQARDYKQDDVVIHNNRLYRANSNIAGGTAFLAGSGGNQWTEVSPPGNPSAPDWASSTAYVQHNLVIHGGVLYRCKTDHTSGSSFLASQWETLKAEAATLASTYQNGQEYVLDQLIEYNGILYRCIEAMLSSPVTFEPDKWQGVSVSYIRISAHSASAVYREGELIWHVNRLYRAKAGINPGRAFSLNDWAISEDTNYVSEYAENEDYRLGQLIRSGVDLYIANEAITGAPAVLDETKWNRVGYRPTVQGAHDDTLAYKQGDIVLKEGTWYEANADIAANVALSEGTTGATWKRVTDSMTIKAHAADAIFFPGQLCLHEERVYTAKEFLTVDSSNTFQSIKWEKLGSFVTLAEDYQDNIEYKKDQIIFHLSVLYRRIATGTDTTWTAANWQALSLTAAILNDFDNTKNYAANEVITRGGATYRVKTPGIKASFVESDWDRIDERPTFRGEWAQANAYKAADFVVRDSILYTANDDVPATTAFSVGTTGATWKRQSPENIAVEHVGAEITVTEGQPVLHRRVLYFATQTVTIPDAFDETGLKKIGRFGMTEQTFEADTWFPAGWLMRQDDKVYKAKTDFTTATAFDVADWDLVSHDYAFIVEFSTADTYYKDQIVINSKLLYRANTDVTVAGAWDSAQWDQLAPAEAARIETHDETNEYLLDDIVFKDGMLWRANSAIAANTPFVKGTSANEWRAAIELKIKAFAEGENILTGEYRLIEGHLAVAKEDIASTAAYATETEKWSILSHDISKLKMVYPVREYLPAETNINYDGSIDGSVSDTWVVTGSLPTTELSVLLWLGYEFHLGGLDVTDKVVQKGSSAPYGFGISGVWIESGDVLEVR